MFSNAFKFIATLFFSLAIHSTDAAAQSKATRIGMAKTFFEGRPKSQIEIATDDFKQVMKKTTALDGAIQSKFDAFEIAALLEKKELEFGIFHAHEFAWVQKKHPELLPILVAANKQHAERAHVVVHKNNPAKSIADLGGKKLDLATGAGASCRMFLNKLCTEGAKKPAAELFAVIEKSPGQADALDAVARDAVQATVVDTFALEFYKEVKGPVFAKNLRVLHESSVFPWAVIVCKKGALDEAVLKQFQGGLLKAHTLTQGRDLMRTWNIDAFETPPQDYDQRLADVLKVYPSPR